jgi:hypothetical protein
MREGEGKSGRAGGGREGGREGEPTVVVPGIINECSVSAEREDREWDKSPFPISQTCSSPSACSHSRRNILCATDILFYKHLSSEIFEMLVML